MERIEARPDERRQGGEEEQPLFQTSTNTSDTPQRDNLKRRDLQVSMQKPDQALNNGN